MLHDNVAPEMARMVLPQSMMVNFIWSGNLLAFYHVYNLRSGEGAQEEAKVFASLLKDAIFPAFPKSWQALQKRDNGTI
jgi:thymidylate synthase (FAD)